jgi:hypothetical protein
MFITILGLSTKKSYHPNFWHGLRKRLLIISSTANGLF